jgi:penicillin-binding protein 1A
VFDALRHSKLVKRIGWFFLALDAWVNTCLYQSHQTLRDRYESYVTAMDRFHVAGWRRVCVELACEGLTLGVAGSIVMLILAMPAFIETSDEDWLKKQDLAITFLDRYGQEVGRRGIRHDDSVPLSAFPDHLIKAVLATEDRRFYEHWGIDPIGTFRALSVNARSSSVVQGGSSITQQLAKNLFLTNERSLERKIKEAFLALWLECHLTKPQILKLYLDRAYMGGGNFGVQAAADFYFDKKVTELTLAESAMLAGLFKAPTKFAPHVNLPAARARANDVLNNIVNAGFMTEGQVFAARKSPGTPVVRHREASPDWYLDFAFEEARKLAQAGKLGDERVLTIRTALDSNLQRHSESVIEEALRQSGKQFRASQGAAIVMEPNGAVRAIVGGRDYGASQFNRATDATRQPGSSFKPFVYLTAVMTGRFHRETLVNGGGICLGSWCPHNYGGASAGQLPMVVALQKSLNTVAVWLSVQIGRADFPANKYPGDWIAAQVGRAKIVENARKMGITTPLTDTVSLPLGAGDVKMIDMAAAYAAFANGGKRVYPFAATEIQNSRGQIIYRASRDGPALEQVIPADKIAEMNNLLKEVVAGGTATAARLEGVVAAGKTGTTNAYHDAWFDGFTGNLVGSVWFGNDDYSSMNNMTGGSLPARSWHAIMSYAHEGLELKNPYGVLDVPPKINLANRPKINNPLAAQAQKPATLNPHYTKRLDQLETLFSDAKSQADSQAALIATAKGRRADLIPAEDQPEKPD